MTSDQDQLFPEIRCWGGLDQCGFLFTALFTDSVDHFKHETLHIVEIEMGGWMNVAKKFLKWQSELWRLCLFFVHIRDARGRLEVEPSYLELFLGQLFIQRCIQEFGSIGKTEQKTMMTNRLLILRHFLLP